MKWLLVRQEVRARNAHAHALPTLIVCTSCMPDQYPHPFNNLRCCHNVDIFSLPWYWWTVVLVLRKHVDYAKLLPQNGRLLLISSVVISAAYRW